MLPVQPGSIIFGEYVEDVSGIKNGKLYILVTKQDGIVFKRIFNFADDEIANSWSIDDSKPKIIACI